MVLFYASCSYISEVFSTFTLFLWIYSICRNEFKREGSGRGNWGTQTDEISQCVYPLQLLNFSFKKCIADDIHTL